MKGHWALNTDNLNWNLIVTQFLSQEVNELSVKFMNYWCKPINNSNLLTLWFLKVVVSFYIIYHDSSLHYRFYWEKEVSKKEKN